MPLVFGPLLYIYMQMTISEDFVFTRKEGLHLSPIVLILLFSLMQAMVSIEGSPSFVEDRGLTEAPPGLDQVSLFNLLMRYLILISFLVYTAMMFATLRRHKKTIQEHFSFDSLRINLKWLKWLMLSFVASYFMVIGLEMSAPLIGKALRLSPELGNVLSLSYLVYSFTFFSLKQETIFSASSRAKEIKEKDNGQKYQKSGFKKEDLNHYLAKLEYYMTRQEPFLNSELSIMDMARYLDMPRHYLAQTINEKLEKNFYTFVNEYRVKKVLQMFADKQYADYTASGSGSWF